MQDVALLLAGLLCAGLGGELFIRGSVGLARTLRVPAGIIGATVAAFATSSPELAVSISAAYSGTPEIALGDALGSNVVNVGLILGIALCMSAIQAPIRSIRRDFPVAVLAPVVTLGLILDGALSRWDAGLLLVVFAVWLISTIREARRERDSTAEVLSERGRRRVIATCSVGLGLLVLAGHLVVMGAKGIGAVLGVSPFVVGATLVAVGTSLPELATVVISKLRGHEEVGLGAVLGSNVFNSFFIVGVAGLIAPVQVTLSEVGVGLAFGLGLVVACFPTKSGWIGRSRGALLLVGYGCYVFALLSSQ